LSKGKDVKREGSIGGDNNVIEEQLMAMAIRYQAARLCLIWSMFQDGSLDAASARYFLDELPTIDVQQVRQEKHLGGT
jgi:hypothetical protein